MEAFIPRAEILPLSQRELWPELSPVKFLGYVLYRGTAVALRLGHRQSVDFDFFTARPVDREALRRTLPFLREAEVTQDSGNTFEALTASGVKLSDACGGLGGRARSGRRCPLFVLSRFSDALSDSVGLRLPIVTTRIQANEPESENCVDAAVKPRTFP